MSAVEPEDPSGELLAAELALGLLDPAERAVAERRLVSDAAFAAEVERWESLAAELLATSDEAVAPEPRVWSGIAAAIGPVTDPMRRAMHRWRALALASMAAAAGLLGVIVLRATTPSPLPPPSPPPLLAVLKADKGPAAGAISYDLAAHRITTRLGEVDARGRLPVLWVIGDDGKPYALGIVTTARSTSNVAQPDRAARLARGVTLAVSLEPRDRPIAPAPTGPVILSGSLS